MKFDLMLAEKGTGGNMNPDIEVATRVQAMRTTSVFILMQRFGNDYWCPGMSFSTLEGASTAAKIGDGITAWRIVRVDNLPVSLEEGES